jgi:hypothetical protein
LISEHTNLARFDQRDCSRCPLKKDCTQSESRTVHVHENEAIHIEFRTKLATHEGRLRYRERTVVEHRLGRIEAIQGPKARYKGARKNELDLCRASAIANLQEIARWRRAA